MPRKTDSSRIGPLGMAIISLVMSDYPTRKAPKGDTMTDIFDESTHPRPVKPGHCFCCGNPLACCPTLPKDERRFVYITGQNWPGSISLNLFVDFERLGLDTDIIPRRGTFCLGCSVTYMEEFNRRFARMKSQRGQ